MRIFASSITNHSLKNETAFDKADTNRDGVIEPKEATSIANQDFAEVDTDDDQVVSIDEFEVALKSQESPRG